MAVRTGGKQNMYYTDGNTVRVFEPVRGNYSMPAQRRYSAPERRTVPEPAVKNLPAARVKMSLIDRLLIAVLIMAVGFTLYVSYSYLQLNASVDHRMDRIEKLEKNIEELRTENDVFEQSINTSVDLNHVYQVAINELGMVHAGRENTIQYKKTESEYVRQYESIAEQ